MHLPLIGQFQHERQTRLINTDRGGRSRPVDPLELAQRLNAVMEEFNVKALYNAAVLEAQNLQMYGHTAWYPNRYQTPDKRARNEERARVAPAQEVQEQAKRAEQEKHAQALQQRRAISFGTQRHDPAKELPRDSSPNNDDHSSQHEFIYQPGAFSAAVLVQRADKYPPKIPILRRARHGNLLEDEFAVSDARSEAATDGMGNCHRTMVNCLKSQGRKLPRGLGRAFSTKPKTLSHDEKAIKSGGRYRRSTMFKILHHLGC